jgi:hypothetical protein
VGGVRLPEEKDVLEFLQNDGRPLKQSVQQQTCIYCKI